MNQDIKNSSLMRYISILMGKMTKTADMVATVFVLVFQIVSCVSSGSSEGLDDNFGPLPRMRSFMNGHALSARDGARVPGFEPGLAKRQDFVLGDTQYTASEAEAIVERHNHFRSITSPSASNMKYMVRFYFILFYFILFFFCLFSNNASNFHIS